MLQHHGEVITRLLRVFLEMLIEISRFRLENLKKKIFCFFCPDLAAIGAKNLSLIVQVKVGGEVCTKGETVFSALFQHETRIRTKMKTSRYLET